MPQVTFRHPNGASETLDVPVGESIMSAAIRESVDGIVAECGGNATCATCHIYVDNGCLDKLPAMQDDEDEMLDGTASPRTERSRLSCQLLVSDEVDGLVVDIPPSQV